MNDGVWMCHHHYEEWKAKRRRRVMWRRFLVTIAFVVTFVAGWLVWTFDHASI